MPHSMAGAVALMRPHLSSSLISPAAFAQIESFSAMLPPIYWGGFECHLDGAPDRVDFHQGYNGAEELQKFLAACARNPASKNRNAFTNLSGFNQQWAREGSVIKQQVDKVSLEFDLAKEKDRLCFPSVFLFLKPFISLERIDHRFKDLVDGFFFHLTGEKTTKNLWSNVRYLATISGGATVENLGAMTARETGGLRLVIVDLPLNRAVVIARHIAPRKTVDHIKRLLTPIADRAETFVLDVDVLNESISPRIGIECYPKKSADASVSWEPFIARFSDLGLCSRDQADGLVRWQGVTTPASCDGPWPDALVLASLLEKAHRFTSFSRYLNHVKIDFSPSRQPRMKAYLGFVHHWIDLKRRSLRGPEAEQNGESS